MEAANAPVGCKGYMFFPFVSSQVSPYYHDNARGGSLGLTLAQGSWDDGSCSIGGCSL